MASAESTVRRHIPYSVVGQLIQNVTTANDTADALQIVLDHACRTTESKWGCIRCYDAEADSLIFRAVFGPESDWSPDICRKPYKTGEKGIGTLCYSTGTTARYDREHTDTPYVRLFQSAKSHLSVPIFMEHNMVRGVLSVDRETEEPYSDEAEHILHFAAGMGSAALQIGEMLDMRSLTSQLWSYFQKPDDLAQAFSNSCSLLKKLLRADEVRIQLFLQDGRVWTTPRKCSDALEMNVTPEPEASQTNILSLPDAIAPVLPGEPPKEMWAQEPWRSQNLDIAIGSHGIAKGQPFLVQPLFHRNLLYGTISGKRKPSSLCFTSFEQTLAQTAANEMVLQLRQSFSVCLVNNVTKEIARYPTIQAGLQHLYETGLRFISSDSGSIRLRELSLEETENDSAPMQAKETIRSIVLRYPGQRRDENVVLPSLKSGIAGHTIRSRSAQLFSTREKIEKYDIPPGSNESRDKRRLESLVIAPMMSGDVALGVIEYGHSKKDAYGHEDLEFIKTLATIGGAFVRSFYLWELFQRLSQVGSKQEIANCIELFLPRLMGAQGTNVFWIETIHGRQMARPAFPETLEPGIGPESEKSRAKFSYDVDSAQGVTGFCAKYGVTLNISCVQNSAELEDLRLSLLPEITRRHKIREGDVEKLVWHGRTKNVGVETSNPRCPVLLVPIWGTSGTSVIGVIRSSDRTSGKFDNLACQMAESIAKHCSASVAKLDSLTLEGRNRLIRVTHLSGHQIIRAMLDMPRLFSYLLEKYNLSDDRHILQSKRISFEYLKNWMECLRNSIEKEEDYSIAPPPSDLGKLVQDFGKALTTENSRIQICMADEIPPVAVAQHELATMICSILDNSYRVAHNLGIKSPQITFRLSVGALNFVRLEVFDNCGGMPETIIEDIMNDEDIVRKPIAKRQRFAGWGGWGLPSIKKIVEAYNAGRFEVRNEGPGVKVTLELPSYEYSGDSHGQECQSIDH